MFNTQHSLLLNVFRFPLLTSDQTTSPRSRHMHLMRNKTRVLLWAVVSTSLNLQSGRPPLVGCTWMLIQHNGRYPPYRGPFLHPQPQDAPCPGDREPFIATKIKIKKMAKRVKSGCLKYFAFCGRLRTQILEGYGVHNFTNRLPKYVLMCILFEISRIRRNDDTEITFKA